MSYMIIMKIIVVNTVTELNYNVVRDWVHLKPHGLYALTYDDP